MEKRVSLISIFLVAALNAQINIAVIDFEGKNVSKDDASALTDRLRAELFLTGKFVVLEREKMDAILKEQGFQQSGCTSDACAVEVGELLAVEQMVAGSISKVGQTFSVTARLVGVEKGDMIGAGKCDLKGDIGDVMTCLSDVASQLAGNQPVPRSEPTRTQATEPTNTVELKAKAQPKDKVFVKGGTVSDIDGNMYQTVKIGDQWWMAENLKVTHYRNGDAIPNVTDNTAWRGLTSGAYCEYDNNSSYVATYGRLYNWYAVTDSRNIAPTGWHVPTDAEWQTLVDYLGGDAVAGGTMKEAGTTHWNSPNIGATNKSGFSALPGGYRDYYGTCDYIGYYGHWWSATEDGSLSAWYRYLYCYNSYVYRSLSSKQDGFSVRCVGD